MIVTRTWLEEWVNLQDISTDTLCEKLNSIGLEVDALTRYRIPEKIVVGYVESCEKHPDADKLSVCRINLGTSTRQIVCGAKNIAAGQYVPVATVGAVMPGGMTIRHAKLRGVESDGMVCSSRELGLPPLGEGIWVLDESIGTLEVGKELAEYPLLNDDVIEIELTANRGDCLSIHGVARELSAAFDRPMVSFEYREKENPQLGIGRILQVAHQGHPSASLIYRAVQFREEATLPQLLALRLAWVDAAYENTMDGFLAYAIHTSGVVLRDYAYEKLSDASERLKLTIRELPDGLTAVAAKERTLSIVGVRQEKEVRAERAEGTILLEASYVAPEVIAPAVKKEKLSTDALYYRTSRGSEPDLEFGCRVLLETLERYAAFDLYAGCSEFLNEQEPRTLDITMEEVEALVGQPIGIAQVVNLLAKLGFVIHKTGEGQIIFDVPAFRHDIRNKQDVIEEIVRMVGIDNIEAKPLCFEEANRITEDLVRYRYVRDLRMRAVAAGFFETVHYIFCDNARLKKFGFESVEEGKRLLNPITGEMDGLRPNLMVNMLDALQRNVAMSKRRVPLFEVGRVFGRDRHESFRMLLAFSGEKEPASVGNAGKPEPIDFATFVQMVERVIGPFVLESHPSPDRLMHPYQSAVMKVGDESVGVVAKLHPEIAEMFDLPDTFFAEIELQKMARHHVNASAIGAFTPVQRDLSVLVPRSMPYNAIRRALEEALPKEVVRFFPIDRYEDEALGEEVSLTLRFVISSLEKTLEESEINAIVAKILETLENRCEARLR